MELLLGQTKSTSTLRVTFAIIQSVKRRQILCMSRLICILILSRVSISTTINSPDGDVIDCVNIEDQLSLSHPLLKDHKLQMFPSGMQRFKKEVGKNWQVWHTTGMICPAGTIPIRRNLDQTFHQKYNPKMHEFVANATTGHKYAIGFIQNRGKIYGSRATFNVWDPIVEASGDFSLAQIWLAAGSYQNADINTIEAGWQVYPSRYHDSQPRLFTYWTIDGYNKTGCYNTDCRGFIHTSNTVALGAAIISTSTFGGTQVDITLQIWKDQTSGNWWLGLGLDVVVPVGYWPAAIFPLLSDHAQAVEWGGEVFYRNISGVNTKAEMGSGEFADKGFTKAAYLCNIQVAEDNYTLMPVQDFGVRADYPKFYTIKKWHNKECGNHFFFGGPGPLRSRAVPATTASVSLVFFFLFGFIL